MPWDRSKGRPEPVAALNRVKELENGEPLVDMRLAAPSILILRPGVIPYCRETVALMAERAAQKMPAGVRMSLVEAWRPLERQRRIYEWLTNCLLEVKPHATRPEIRRRVNRFVAPVDQPAPPGHCTGAAIDINLVDEQGELLDVSSPLMKFQSAPTYVYGLSAQARANRFLLVDAMLEVGFTNCRDEWWHYSYGDAGWAVRLGLQECIYGLVELDPPLYAQQLVAWEEQFKQRVNPWLE